MLQKIKQSLLIQELKDIPLDDPQRPNIVRKTIQKKPFLKNIYLDFYKQFQKAEIDLSELNAPSLELGSGGGFLKKIIPNVITSDIVPEANVDRTENAYQLNFSDNSLKAIYMVDVLHHLGKANLFFQEANRCLKPGGQIIMIEPHTSWFGSFIYKYLHHEGYNKNTKTWNFPDTGPLSSANLALPSIIFQRDRKKFEELFPKLKIKNVIYHNFILYLISGGLTLKQLLPTCMYKPIYLFEKALQPFMKTALGCFQTIIIEKTYE